MGKRRKVQWKQARDGVRRADEKWLAEGGLDRPHTKLGVSSARRLMSITPARLPELKAYVRSAPPQMPVSDHDYDSVPTLRPAPQKARAKRPKMRYREVSGGAPGLGKRR